MKLDFIEQSGLIKNFGESLVFTPNTGEQWLVYRACPDYWDSDEYHVDNCGRCIFTRGETPSEAFASLLRAAK